MAALAALNWPGSCSIFWGFISVSKVACASHLVRQIGTVIKCGVFFSVLVMAVHHIFTDLIIVCIRHFNILPASYSSNMLRTGDMLSGNLQMPRSNAALTTDSI